MTKVKGEGQVEREEERLRNQVGLENEEDDVGKNTQEEG